MLSGGAEIIREHDDPARGRDRLLRGRRVVDGGLSRAPDERRPALDRRVRGPTEDECAGPAEVGRLPVDGATTVGRGEEHPGGVELFADHELRSGVAVTGRADEVRAPYTRGRPPEELDERLVLVAGAIGRVLAGLADHVQGPVAARLDVDVVVRALARAWQESRQLLEGPVRLDGPVGTDGDRGEVVAVVRDRRQRIVVAPGDPDLVAEGDDAGDVAVDGRVPDRVAGLPGELGRSAPRRAAVIGDAVAHLVADRPGCPQSPARVAIDRDAVGAAGVLRWPRDRGGIRDADRESRDGAVGVGGAVVRVLEDLDPVVRGRPAGGIRRGDPQRLVIFVPQVVAVRLVPGIDLHAGGDPRVGRLVESVDAVFGLRAGARLDEEHPGEPLAVGVPQLRLRLVARGSGGAAGVGLVAVAVRHGRRGSGDAGGKQADQRGHGHGGQQSAASGSDGLGSVGRQVAVESQRNLSQQRFGIIGCQESGVPGG